MLISSGQLRQSEVASSAFAGELALDGVVRPISGAITIAETARDAGLTTLYLPTANIAQAQLIRGINIIGIESLKSLYLHLKGEVRLLPVVELAPTAPSKRKNSPLLDDIYGQEQAKRALTIAAAGHHNILFTGTPGAGKTMLAKTIVSLLPDLSPEEQLQATKLHSLAGTLIDDVVRERPFRSPHHTSSQIALIGGGTKPRPGEMSLAHHGVLFLDEIPEYPRNVLEALRQPLEDHVISVTRASGRANYPAHFMLVATMNPCPCGYYGDPEHECSCSTLQIIAYQKRLSGPLLDRIDMVIPVSRIPNELLLNEKSMSSKQHIAAQNAIALAKQKQYNRYESSTKSNSSLSSSEIKKRIPLDKESKAFLDTAAAKLKLSARGYFKVIKVARTIADLTGDEHVAISHLAEALQFRGSS